MLAILAAAGMATTGGVPVTVSDLPVGSSPAALSVAHFPDRLHAFVWRNWDLVPIDRMARVVGTKPDALRRIGRAMGLAGPPRVSKDLEARSYITVIRRNWHLLPYDQLVELLGWTPERLAFTLREDDFLYVKLGLLKPRCERLVYREPDVAVVQREREIAAIVAREVPTAGAREPLFAFVRELSRPAPANAPVAQLQTVSPRFCYSYFAPYGDPLTDGASDPYPDGYLARLATSGADGVWLQAVLYKLAPFPWDSALSESWETRLRNLNRLVARARKRGVGVWLYLNEPRAMPLAFYEKRPELKGVVEGDHAALCSSAPEVQAYLASAVETITRRVPGIAGFFTISGSENLSNCWSHYGGAGCPRCGRRTGAEVIAELHNVLQQGIARGGSHARLIAWDWGWPDDWTPGIIAELPDGCSVQSVSEWSLPIKRGGVETTIGEYSISAIGPGPRATRAWKLARDRGLRAMAKVQMGTTWELGSVPYLPAIANVAQHTANLRTAGVDGLMLGWTLGGWPSPNLEVVASVMADPTITPENAMLAVAGRRFGAGPAAEVVRTWQAMSTAFGEFPYHGGVVYSSPHHSAASNLLWEKPTGFTATMVGIPYDDLNGWRAVYPPDVLMRQYDLVADGFERGAEALTTLERGETAASSTPDQRSALRQESDIAGVAAIQYRSTANQGRFVMARDSLAAATTAEAARPHVDTLERMLKAEIELARRLYVIQRRDSRVGFEATNHYFFIPSDLVEKVLNCHDLLDRWLPAERARRGL